MSRITRHHAHSASLKLVMARVLMTMIIVIMVLYRCQHPHQDSASEHCTKRVRLCFSNADMVMTPVILVVMIMVIMAIVLQMRWAEI